jgi:hypothetical protein
VGEQSLKIQPRKTTAIMATPAATAAAGNRLVQLADVRTAGSAAKHGLTAALHFSPPS